MYATYTNNSNLILASFVDMYEGTIGSMRKLGITESYKLKRQVVISASEATEMILRYVFYCNIDSRDGLNSPFAAIPFRVDTILRATPRKREAM